MGFAYALVLGRAPEAQVREQWAAKGLTVGELLGALMVSTEFVEDVAGRWLSGRALVPRFVAPLTRSGREWAQSVFGEEAVAGADTWLQLLLRLQASGALSSLGPGLEDRPRHGGALAAVSSARSSGGAALEASVYVEIESFDGLRLRGWAVDLAEPDRAVRLELWMQGRFLQALAPDRFRRDVQDRYGGSGRTEFDLFLSPLEAVAGRRLRLEIRTADGRVVAESSVMPAGADRMDAVSAVRSELSAVRALLERVERAMPAVRARTGFSLASYGEYARLFAEAWPPRVDAGELGAAPVTVIVRRGLASAARLEAALESLLGQGDTALTVFVAPDALGDPARTAALIESMQAGSPPWMRLQLGPSTADAIGAEGLVLYMSADDRLAPGALHAFRAAHGAAKVLYADDDRLPFGERAPADDPRFKPPLDRHLLLQENYVGSVFAVDARLVQEAAVALPGLSDHARVLRAVAHAGPTGVRHLPRVLSHRADAAEPQADAAAVEAELKRRGLAAVVAPHDDLLAPARAGALRLHPRGLHGRGASVIVSTRDRPDLLGPCIRSLLRTRADNQVRFEVLVVDNGGVTEAGRACLQGLAQEEGVRVLRDDGPFNWALLNNRAAMSAEGEVLVFLNDDTLAVSATWCDELCWWALQPEVGAVGARLLYEDGAIQHAGVVLGRGRSASHEGVGEPGGDGGYLGRHLLVHATSAVTGACLATRAELFRALDGFDGARFPVAFNDIDYCLRARERGLDSVYTPHATFHHFESKSRGFGDEFDMSKTEAAREELALFQRRHADALVRDPWMNAHFEVEARPFTLLAPQRL